METIESVNEFVKANKNIPIFDKRELKNVEKLSGGLVNYVFRLEFTDQTTCILKYYPRFLAFDRTVEMSQNRYFVEKNALVLLQDQPWQKLHPLSRIRTPKLLYFDDSQFVMIMEDAGKTTQTLFNYLTNREELKEDEEKFLGDLAKYIKEFSTYLSDHSGITLETHRTQLENKSAKEMISEYVSSVCVDQAKELKLERELEPYLKDLKRAFLHDDDPNLDRMPTKKVFVFGDLWPNSILIDRERNFVWIIDWEMARFETRMNDLEQLMANFWVMKQNEALFNVKRIERLMCRLQLEFFGDERKDWRRNVGEDGNVSFILWVTSLVKEKHWELKDQRDVLLNALKEIQ